MLHFDYIKLAYLVTRSLFTHLIICMAFNDFQDHDTVTAVRKHRRRYENTYGVKYDKGVIIHESWVFNSNTIAYRQQCQYFGIVIYLFIIIILALVCMYT